MKNSLVIRLPLNDLDASSSVSWMLFDQQGQCLDNGNTLIEQLKAEVDVDEDVDIVVIAPAESLLLTEVSIPSKQMRQIKQALPFVVEELIADDIENVHMAIPASLDPEAETLEVAVLAHRLLIHWLDVLHSNQLPPASIVIDSLCLPLEENGWSLLIDNDRLLIRSGEFSAMVVAMPDVELVFAALVKTFKSTDNPLMPKINVISSAHSETGQKLSAQMVAYLRKYYAEFEIKESLYQESIGQIISAACHDQKSTAMNLLQGGYAVARNREGTSKRWLLAASIAAVGLVGYLCLSVLGGWYFSTQAKALDQQSIALYKQLFPQERRIVSPRKQLQNHLRLAESSQNSSFLGLLAETSKQLAGSEDKLDTSVNQLRFDSDRGDLQLELKVRSLDQLAQLKQQLANAGLKADINSASEQDNVVVGRIAVRKL